KLLGAVFRWPALRAQGRIAADGRPLPPPVVPQLVPSVVSLHLRHIPVGCFVMYARALANEFAREVRAGLTRAGQKTLSCRYLYDDIGSALFEAITYLPEYGLTRADARLIQLHAPALLGQLPENLIVAELGSGTGNKTYAVLERLRQRQPVTYYPIDVSPIALD